MNIFAVVILATLLLEFVLNLVADALNMSSLKRGLPEEFKGVYDVDTYRKSQEYSKVTTRFGIITSVFNLAVLLVFWFAGGFDVLDQWVRGFGWNPIWTGLAYVGILMFLRSIIGLPFSIYQTFVIEERFGFNKTTVKTFILDMVKGTLLGIVLGGPLLAGVLAFFQYGGPWAWVYAWAVVTGFTLLLQYVAPRWIMPLFNKFEPLEDGELKEAILDLADRINFPLQGVYVMDGSKRSSKSNAFFTGFGKNKRIALFDTLIENHSVSELVAVLAHEIGHYKKKHIVQNMVISILHTGVMFWLLSLVLQADGLYAAFYMQQASVYAGFIFFGMLYAPVELILSMVMQVISRKHEFQADHFAANATDHPQWLITALKKLSRDNLSNLTPHPFYVFLNYSHPPVLERIKALRAEKT